MKKVLTVFFWAISLGVSFYIGKSSVNPETIIETQQVIRIKEKLVKSTESGGLSKVNIPKASEKDKKENKNEDSQDSYYKKRYDFLTKEEGRNEAIIDCRDGKEYACWKLEEYYRYTGQKNKLLDQMKSKCTGEKVDSCVSLFYMVEGKKAKNQITSKLKKNCKTNNAKACVSLGNIVEYGDTKIDKMAFKLREKGCELDVKTCSSLASSLHRVNDPRAGEFYLKACEAGGEHSCMSASRYFFETGQKEEGGQVLRMGCDQNQNYECRQYYEFLLANKRLDEAQALNRRACDNEKTKDFFYCKQPN